MGIKITYTDTETHKVLREVELTDNDLKAMSVELGDVVEWHVNFLNHRKRQCINKVVEEALKPESKLLTDDDRRAIAHVLVHAGIIVCSPRDLPEKIKMKIVRHANLDALKPATETP